MTRATRCPLLIDPQGQGRAWLVAHVAAGGGPALCMAQPEDKGFRTLLEVCNQFLRGVARGARQGGGSRPSPRAQTRVPGLPVDGRPPAGRLAIGRPGPRAGPCDGQAVCAAGCRPGSGAGGQGGGRRAGLCAIHLHDRLCARARARAVCKSVRRRLYGHPGGAGGPASGAPGHDGGRVQGWGRGRHCGEQAGRWAGRAEGRRACSPRHTPASHHTIPTLLPHP